MLVEIGRIQVGIKAGVIFFVPLLSLPVTILWLMVSPPVKKVNLESGVGMKYLI